MPASILLISVALTIITPVASDPLDWVNVQYVARQAKLKHSATSEAQDTIARGATSTSKSGPWSITDTDKRAPSNDIHDYLSWAPYHWPDCNWCSSRNHLSSNGTSTKDELDNLDSEPYPDGGSDFEDDGSGHHGTDKPTLPEVPSLHNHRRMNRIRRRNFYSKTTRSGSELEESLPQAPLAGSSPSSDSDSFSDSHSAPPTSTVFSLPHAPQVAAAKVKPNKTEDKSKPPCTPSPTKSMAPSATWTQCRYKTRDGKANPDVRTLKGPGSIQKLSQSLMYSAVTYVLKGSSVHSKNIAKFVNTFFLDAATKMNPHISFGQIVRGPGATGRQGTAMGILDLRGMVKICNAIMMIRAAGSPDWTNKLNEGMMHWMDQYSRWLVESDLGKNAAGRSNNHASFYYSQVAAAQILAGQDDAARSLLQKFFASSQFGDQIAASGEQPFEAVRTRPFHYRCFNLEALIVNAKLGDQLGLDLWSVKTKHGATLQTALDFIMSVDPKKEDVREAIPHVASIAAAYGDPLGKYDAYMRKHMPNYETRPFFFYDQTDALPFSPAANGLTHKRGALWAREEEEFACPDVFSGGVNRIELDNGIFVTCKDVKPFYLVERL